MSESISVPAADVGSTPDVSIDWAAGAAERSAAIADGLADANVSFPTWELPDITPVESANGTVLPLMAQFADTLDATLARLLATV